jgi:hypothetical protein
MPPARYALAIRSYTDEVHTDKLNKKSAYRSRLDWLFKRNVTNYLSTLAITNLQRYTQVKSQ